MTYSLDFRRKVLAVREKEQLSLAKVSKRFGLGLNTVMRWTKNITAKNKRNKPSLKIDMEALKHDIQKYPDAYQYERAKRLNVSKAAIWYALKRLRVSYKKNSTAPQGSSRKTLYILPNA
jgi:transposase